MIGEIAALSCAPLWAVSAILLKSQTDRLGALQISAMRGLFASPFLLAVALISGRIDLLDSLSASSISCLLLSVLIGIGLGDTLYIRSMGLIGVSRALPISITYPIFVLPFSVAIVGERLSVLTIGGIFITVMGLFLITAPQRGAERSSDITRKQHWWGIFFILAASLCWAVGTTILNFAMTDLDPILATAIRVPFITLVLFAIFHLRKGDAKIWNQGLNSLAIIGLAGVLGIGVGVLLFVSGVKYAGPAKTATLSATTPLFGVPLSMLILREKITPRIVLGTILCVVGIWFVV